MASLTPRNGALPVARNPRRGWRLVAIAVVALVPARGAFADPDDATTSSGEQAPLGEEEMIRLGRARTPGAAVAAATEGLAEARARTAGLFPNPALDWARETVDSGPVGGQGAQDLFTASVPIDVARRLTTRSLVASEEAWLRAEASVSRGDAVLDALLAYYDVVWAERRVVLLSEAVSNLEEASRVLLRREAAGAASGYESTRLAIASELSQSQLAEARGVLDSTRARLGALLGVPPASLRIATDLQLRTDVSESMAAVEGPSRPAVDRAVESLQLARDAVDRAAWSWLPALSMGGGLKRANNFAADSGYGYVIGISLDVPIFDYGQADRQQAEAQRALANARADAMRRVSDAEAKSALATYLVARRELARFESHTSGRVEALLASARSGYREGERSIVDLLDAQKVQTEVAERRLALLAKAKSAEARLRAAVGEFQ
ncbi:MAG: TolC family protein [Myxococcota bacterium]